MRAAPLVAAGLLLIAMPVVAQESWPVWSGGEDAAGAVEKIAAASDGPSVQVDIPRFGGPSSVGEELAAADRPKEPLWRFGWMDDFLAPWFDMKSRLRESTGISFGLHYNTLTQWLSESDGEDFAAGGIFEFLGTWSAFGERSGNRGSLTWKFENRHRLGTDVAPQFLGFEAGILSLTGTKFSDYGWGMSNLYWRQEFLDGELLFQFGWLDPTDYLDVYAMENPLAGFQNFVFTANPTIAIPSEGSIGLLGAAWLAKTVYFIAGFADANGVPTQRGIDTFFDDREYFWHAEVGWTPNRETRYLDKVSLLWWRSDEREAAGVPDAWGLAFTATTFLDDRWMPFLRIGWSDGDVALMEATVSAGIGHYFSEEGDLAGLGINWSRPSGDDLDDQWTGELFYRVQVAENFQFTPSLQLVVHPALNPDESAIWVAGLRARLTF